MKRLISVGLALLIVAGWVFIWSAMRDPIGSLPPPEHGLAAEHSPLTLLQPQRRIEHVTLHSQALGDIGIAINLPDPLPARKLPIVLVLGGLGTGENNIRYVADVGDNAIIGFDWPMPVRFYAGLEFILQMPDLYERLMTVPGQITSALSWLQTQDWADTQRVSILGFSLGALAAPVAQDLAQHDGQTIGWTILAYGGSPFGTLFTANPHFKPAWMRPVLGPVIDFLLRPLEPTEHLPHLSGHFLVLEGHDDGLVPAAARDNLRDATPEPKTVIVFDGNHMGVGADKMALLQKIIDASKDWLAKNGAVNGT